MSFLIGPGFNASSPPPIGDITPNTVAATTLTATTVINLTDSNTALDRISSGVARMFGSNHVTLQGNNNDGGGSVAFVSAVGTVLFAIDAANTLALRNGTNAQTLNVYNTFTDGGNYESAVIGYNSNILLFQSASAGSGTNRAILIRTNGSADVQFGVQGGAQWKVSGATGHFLAVTDNTYDIGASGATRPRDVFIARNLLLTGIPTSDPHVIGEVWSNLGILTLSAG